MKRTLLDTLICPLCHADLALVTAEERDGVIDEGLLVCTGCGHPWAIHNRIPIMLSPRLPDYEKKMGEARGWVAISQAEGWYEPTDALDLSLPNPVETFGWDPVEGSTWLATKYSFAHLLDWYVKPGMRVLEVGAARTWAGRFFVERGCTYTACDIVTDPKIGLGRSQFFIDHAGHYEAVAADFEYLPFKSGSYDLVFAIAALHHALDLPRMLAEMSRVCRVGGVVAGLNEGVRAYGATADTDVQAAEKTYGINEHVYTLTDYFGSFWRSGLRVNRFERGIGYEWFMSEENKRRVALLQQVPLAGEWLAPLMVLGFAHPNDGVSLYATKMK